VPTENLILYDQRWRPMRPASTAPDLRFFLRKVPGAIRVSSLKICGWRILGTRWRRPADDEAGWCGSLGA
jgi:hypothetical protein